ncbi:3-keto-disaccharide hydrolase [Marinoscillum sp.]|uniref:3-keto-disaccharide hydrolase n=1 Tax=Marinoscillum sp. TaxID=2024838 RepID=UPI003BAB8EF7
MKTLFYCLVIGISFSAVAQNWQPIFNGTDLTGWETKGGKAPYKVENGTIIGTAVLNSPNTFLCTKKTYSDFILEFEVFLPNHLNTGVQFRSNFDGVVKGYQCEIDPSDRAFSGGVYDEQRRGWMYPISLNKKASSAFQLGMWNKFRIECLGSEIRTYINGQMCSNLMDDMTNEGFIGLQVHSIGEKEEGYLVKWRDIRILTEQVAEYRNNPDPEVLQMSYLKNQLTDWEKRNGWRLLWDGKTNAGWRGAKLDDFPSSGWTMENGELTVLATDGGEATGPGDIVTTSNYSNFELELEFKITEGANSGIKYFVDPSLNKNSGSAIGCEFQILDDQKHPDAKMGVNGNRTVGSLYDLIAAENLSVPGRGKQFKGIGQWNKARIVSKDGKVEHWLNNEKIIEYDRFSQMFRALVAYSKYKVWDNFGQWPEGSILLQDHGNQVSYRSIKIRELN